jgi:DNA-binding transcriptional MerR regulator
MSIGGLSRKSGVPVSTIRFYERLGLISAAGRTEGNYRYFGFRALDRLQFIRAAQASGLSLEDIRMLCQFDDGAMKPCKDVQAVIESRLNEVTEQMKHLRHAQHVLRGYRDSCQKTSKGKPCPVLSGLRNSNN